MERTYEMFKEIVDNNYGSQHYYRNMFDRKFFYTDGVKAVAEKMECFWLIDMVESYCNDVRKFADKNMDTPLMESVYMDIVLDVKDNKADFSIKAYGYDDEKEDEIATDIATQHIGFTDLPNGEYKFFLGLQGDKELVMFLTSEY